MLENKVHCTSIFTLFVEKSFYFVLKIHLELLPNKWFRYYVEGLFCMVDQIYVCCVKNKFVDPTNFL